MEGKSSDDVIVELEYKSQLTAGLDAARYYLSKSVKESTKTQVLILLSLNNCRDKLQYFPLIFYSTTVCTISGAASVETIMYRNSETTTDHWRHVFLLS